MTLLMYYIVTVPRVARWCAHHRATYYGTICCTTTCHAAAVTAAHCAITAAAYGVAMVLPCVVSLWLRCWVLVVLQDIVQQGCRGYASQEWWLMRGPQNVGMIGYLE